MNAIAFAAVSLVAIPQLSHAQSAPRDAVAATPYFAFYSDFATNLNDALITAGGARRAEELELFRSGPEKACFDELVQAERAAWDRAVDFYGEVVSPGRIFDREQFLLRLHLAGATDEEATPSNEDHVFVEVTRGFLAAAAPAYRACRWDAQDEANQRWIANVVALLNRHEETLADEHVRLYEAPWHGLPLLVDIVETAGWAGASSIYLDPDGGHILISSSQPSNQENAAIEIVFHEAAHTLTGRGSPLRQAVDDALQESGLNLRGDLTHMVHFYMTGEAVRRVLDEAGEPGYRPYMDAQNLFMEGGRLRGAIESTWPAYMNGERSLAETVADLVRALGEPGGASGSR